MRKDEPAGNPANTDEGASVQSALDLAAQPCGFEFAGPMEFDGDVFDRPH